LSFAALASGICLQGTPGCRNGASAPSERQARAATSRELQPPASASAGSNQPRSFRLNASGGIGFDDLFYSPELRAVLVPAGVTGCVNLFDGSSLSKTALCGVSSAGRYSGGHGEGVTSADVGMGFVFAIDRTSRTLKVIDPKSRQIVATAALGASPDYVRWFSSKREVWVTEPDAEQIELFAVSSDLPPKVTRTMSIAVKGGPESLVLDTEKGRVFTHLWNGRSVQIDLATHTVGRDFANGCQGSRGIGLDPEKGLLFVGCAEGKAVVLDVDRMQVLDSRQVPSGVDIVAVNTTLHHLYVPAASDGTVTVLGVSARGKLTLLGTVQTAKGAHCVTSDDHNRVWICDPAAGSVMVFDDNFPTVAE
jgi:DNA-binding beta-propeller fold protein YncE